MQTPIALGPRRSSRKWPFWHAYLRGDERARSWLAEGGCEATLGHDAAFEKKPR